MTTTTKLYYLAAALALAAALVSVIRGGLEPNEHFHVGFLVLMALVLLWLGRRNQTRPTE